MKEVFGFVPNDGWLGDDIWAADGNNLTSVRLGLARMIRRVVGDFDGIWPEPLVTERAVPSIREVLDDVGVRFLAFGAGFRKVMATHHASQKVVRCVLGAIVNML